jgi:hypothetical protein
MSDPHFSSLAVMHKHWLTNCYGEEVSQLLTGERIPRHPDRAGLHSPYYRRLNIVTQGGWFHSKVKELQRLSGAGGLAYLREDTCTHEHKEVTRDNADKVVWAETHGYTVLRSGWARRSPPSGIWRNGAARIPQRQETCSRSAASG